VSICKPRKKKNQEGAGAPPPLLNVPVVNGRQYPGQIVCPTDGHRYYRNGPKCRECRQCVVDEKAEIAKLKPAQLEERGFFQVSKPVKERKSLTTWVKHFKCKGIKTTIRETKYGFTLWREGEEAENEEGERL